MKKRGTSPALELVRLSPKVTLGVIWSATFLFAFFYYAYKYNATAPVDGGETVIQSVAKPAYCRNDMPGCVPSDILNVFWVATPESGSDVVLKFITMQGRNAKSSGMQLASCNLASAVGDSTYCFSSTGEHHEPETREKACKAQGTAVGLLHQQPFFERLRCNFATGQYDFSILYSLPKDILERTLIVLTVRDPIQQTAAMHRVFCQLDPARMCPALDTSNSAHINYKKCTSLSDFARRGFAGSHPLDSLVRRLAGDYCCYQPELFADDHARMEAALMNFLRIGVVIDGGSLPSGLEYLAHVLGWDKSSVSAVTASLPLENIAAPEQRKLQGMLRNDYAMYNIVRQRLAEQSEYMSGMDA